MRFFWTISKNPEIKCKSQRFSTLIITRKDIASYKCVGGRPRCVRHWERTKRGRKSERSKKEKRQCAWKGKERGECVSVCWQSQINENRGISRSCIKSLFLSHSQMLLQKYLLYWPPWHTITLCPVHTHLHCFIKHRYKHTVNGGSPHTHTHTHTFTLISAARWPNRALLPQLPHLPM